MFQKLKYEFIHSPINKIQSHIKFGVVSDQKFRGIEYFDLGLSNTKNYWNLLPEKYRSDFALLLMQINSSVPAHTDSGIKCTINFYKETQNCITAFYKETESVKKFQIENQTDGYIYDEQGLIEIGSFLAKPNEVWLLDVTIPHSVKPNRNHLAINRTAVTLATSKYAYDDVCGMIKETGWL